MTKTAWLFAGQGAQFVGMGKDLAGRFPECRDLYDRADDTLGYPLSTLCFEGPPEQLTMSNHCQPAIFTTSMACLAAWRATASPVDPVGAGGLSLGEWTALHVAGALSFEDTLRVLEARGRFMQEACEETDGAMASVIGLNLETLQAICRETGAVVANLNSPEQTVVSGARPSVEAAERLAKEKGAKRTLVLNVAGGFHSPLMRSAAKRLEDFLEGVALSPLRIPVMANATGRAHGDPDDVRRNMVAQVTQSVQWVSCMERLRELGPDAWIEFGPGRVLSGLLKRVDSDANVCHIQDLSSLEKAQNACETQKEA